MLAEIKAKSKEIVNHQLNSVFIIDETIKILIFVKKHYGIKKIYSRNF